MNKTFSMSIRVSEDELSTLTLKKATELESYSSYSEFVRRTALIEAFKVIQEKSQKSNTRRGLS